MTPAESLSRSSPTTSPTNGPRATSRTSTGIDNVRTGRVASSSGSVCSSGRRLVRGSSRIAGNPMQPSVELQGKRGAGAFQWNRGGWFGSQLGATLWLALLGGLLLAQSQSVGALLVLCAAVPNLVGLALWRRRHSVSPYPAIQCLVAACGLGALVAMLGLRAAGVAQSPAGMPSSWFLLMYPGLMLAFHLQERAARRTAA